VTEKPEDEVRGEGRHADVWDRPGGNQEVAQDLFSLLQQAGAIETTNFLGGDSYNGNKGWKGERNAYMERMLGHKCH
jgi:hypothetical protein